MSAKKRWYLDACAIIRLLERHDDARYVHSILQRAALGEADIVLSTLIKVEVSRKRDQPVDPVRYAQVLRFFENSYIRLIDVYEQIADLAAELLLSYLWLRPNDSIHLATAIIRQCDVFLTTDSALINRFNGERGLTVIHPASPMPTDSVDTSEYPLWNPTYEGEPV